MRATTVKNGENDKTLTQEASLKKEAIINAFFEKRAEEAKIFLQNNPVPAELLRRNIKQ